MGSVLVGMLAALLVGELHEATPLRPIADKTTFKGAVSRALEKSPTAAIARSELRRAHALVEQARAASLPTLSVTGEYARLGPDSLAAGGVGGSGQFLAALDNWVLSATASVPLLAPAAWAQWAHAENDVTVAGWTEKEARRQLALAAAHAYLTIIAEKRIVESNTRACTTDRAHFEYTEKRHAGGKGTPLDEMRARQQYESDLAQLDGAMLGLERAQETLGVLLGEEHAVDTEDEPALEAPPETKEPTEAWRERPDFKQGEARAAAARQVDEDFWTDFVPTLGFSFLPSYQTPAYVPRTPLTWEFVFTAGWTLYDGGLRYGLHKERKERRLQADLGLEGQALGAGAEVRSGFRAITRTDEALAAALAAASAAHEAFEVANQQYKAGATTNIDVVDAERRSHDADTAAAIAEDAARQARLDLLGALGKFP